MADSIDSEDNDITIEDAKTEATKETVTDENAGSQETTEANDNNKTETVEMIQQIMLTMQNQHPRTLNLNRISKMKMMRKT